MLAGIHGAVRHDRNESGDQLMTTIVRVVQPGEIIAPADLNDPTIRVRTVCAPRPDETTVNGVVVQPAPAPEV